MIFTPYVIPLLASAAILIWIMFYTLRFKEVPTARIFSLLIGLMALWALNQAINISATWLDLKIFLTLGLILGNVFIPTLTLLLVLTYSGQTEWLRRKRLALLLIVPLFFVVLTLTNPYHHLFFYDFRLDLTGAFPILLKTKASGFWIYLAYSYGMLVITVAVLLAALRKPQLSYRITLLLFVIIFIPLIVDMIDNMVYFPIHGFSLAPIAFILSGVLYSWAMLRYRLFSVAPVARSIVMENTADVVIVLDNHDHIVDFNPAAQSACGLTARSVGALTEFLPKEWADLFRCFQQVTEYQGEISLGEGKEERSYDLSIIPIQDEENRPVGRLFILHDLSRSKQAAENLRISEKRFRLLTDNAPLAVVVTDLNTGKVLYGNPRLAELLETPLENLLGGNVLNLYVVPHDRERLLQLLFASNQVSDFEVRMKKGDGREFWSSLTANISLYDGIPAIHATYVDITERKRAEEELRIKERAFTSAINAIAIADLQGRLTYVNPAFLRLWGYSLDEVLRMYVIDFWYPPERAREIIQQIASGVNWEGEMTAKRKDGSLFDAQLSTTLVLDESGQPLYMLGTFVDITERKQVEQALQVSKERYDNLAEHNRTFNWEVDAQGRYTYVSRVVEQVLGYKADEITAKKFFYDLHPERMREEFKATAFKFFERKEAFKDLENQMLTKDGQIVWVSTNGIPMLDAHGELIGYRGSDADITEQKKMEAVLIESQKMAGIGTLVAGIAHELNTPLQVITGYSDSLVRDLKEAGKLEGERPERQLNTLNRNAWRVAEIVRTLQHYAHPDRDRFDQANLNDLLKNSLILMEHQLKSWENIQIESSLAEDLPHFTCEQNKIIQLMINLLSNAHDAMPDGGTIRIDTSYAADKDRLVLKISDDGKGIPEAVRGRIFDPFYTTKPVGKGTGLGLSIVQSIVRAHGGEIKVESTPRKGTTFTITLPLIPPVQDTENLPEESTRARYD